MVHSFGESRITAHGPKLRPQPTLRAGGHGAAAAHEEYEPAEVVILCPSCAERPILCRARVRAADQEAAFGRELLAVRTRLEAMRRRPVLRQLAIFAAASLLAVVASTVARAPRPAAPGTGHQRPARVLLARVSRPATAATSIRAARSCIGQAPTCACSKDGSASTDRKLLSDA
jgi:hypothetical protein